MSSLIILVGSLVAFSGCSNDPVQPLPPVEPFPECGNDEALTPLDSLLQKWPAPRYSIRQLQVSPFNGYWLGLYRATTPSYQHQVFVYDPISDTHIFRMHQTGGHPYFSWSPDGRRLLVIDIVDKMYLFDVQTRELYPISSGKTVYDYACWSADGSRIYLSFIYQGWSSPQPEGIYAVNPDGSGLTMVTNSRFIAKVLDSNRLFGIERDTIFIYDMRKDSLTKIYKPVIDPYMAAKYYDISPDKRFVLYETRSYGYELNPWGNGLWIMDTKQWEARKIRTAQRWNHEYYPTWASNNSFYASVFCKKDSSSMVWEFDLNGNPIRQVTMKSMKVWNE